MAIALLSASSSSLSLLSGSISSSLLSSSLPSLSISSSLSLSLPFVVDVVGDEVVVVVVGLFVGGRVVVVVDVVGDAEGGNVTTGFNVGEKVFAVTDKLHKSFGSPSP